MQELVEDESEMSKIMSKVSLTLAEGAPARVSAITQSLHQFRPSYVHILRPKSYRDEEFLR